VIVLRGKLTDPAGKNLFTGSEVSSWLGHDIPALDFGACTSVPDQCEIEGRTTSEPPGLVPSTQTDKRVHK
jgi:hypothetical protein